MLQTGSNFEVGQLEEYVQWLKELKALECQIVTIPIPRPNPRIYFINHWKSLKGWKKQRVKINRRAARNFMFKIPGVEYELDSDEDDEENGEWLESQITRSFIESDDNLSDYGEGSFV